MLAPGEQDLSQHIRPPIEQAGPALLKDGFEGFEIASMQGIGGRL